MYSTGNGSGNGTNRSNKEWEGPRVVPSHSAPSKGVPHGASQIGPFDFVPKLGYREYWYPAAKVKEIGKRAFGFLGRRKPIVVKMLGDEIALFPGKDGRIAAIRNRCPHRGAIFTPQGRCEFDGTISCPYHGSTYDETGTCVAALTEGPDSGLVGKLKVRTYPTAVVRGIVFVWMGQTAPVPIEEDLPGGFFDSSFVVVPYSKIWPMNWTLTVENSGDNHGGFIHRFRIHRIFNMWAFQELPAYWPGVKIIEQTERSVSYRPAGTAPKQAYYPLLGKKWPQHVWYRFRKLGTWRRPYSGPSHKVPRFIEYRLPSMAFIPIGGRYWHLRWATPINEDTNRMFSFGMAATDGKWYQKLYWNLYLRTVYRTWVVKGTNELEDFNVIRSDRLDPYEPEKLGANDAPNIIWRRRLPMTSRDNVRVWKKGMQVSAEEEGKVKDFEAQPPPTPTVGPKS